MATVQEEFKKNFERSHTDLYKELEVIKEPSLLEQKIKQGQNTILKVYRKNVLDHDASNKPMTVKAFKNEDEVKGDVHFHRATKFLVLYGQFLGLNPVSGILKDDTSKLRFTFSSFKILISLFMFICQSGAFMICWYRMIQTSLSIGRLGEILFYAESGMATCVFMKVSMNWPSLLKAVAASNLEEYMDTRIKRRCNITTVVFIILTIVEHILVLILKITIVMDCFPAAPKNMFQAYTEFCYPWLFDLGLSYNMPLGILLQIFNTMVSLCWNYYDIFVICISLYIASILELIHKKIVSAKRTKSSLVFWRSMRVDYTRASRLVRSFDSVISSVIFTSFAANSGLICLQLYNILSDALSAESVADHSVCPNYPSGPFNGYENEVYFYYSIIFIFGRTLMVSLTAANVHSIFMMIAPALYELPSSVYCDEIQRFIYQVHNDNVALSGLQFFYITKEMLLSVVGTIVTYELVLLQYGGGDATSNA